jgi:(1->4)-alpha-D-glucan 1-alpha-D-glucosylmutase
MTPLVATYRLQLGPTLTLEDARRVVPYLHDLGVSHLYLSPVMQARAGSTHGYDVVDPTRVSDVLGGEAALRALAAEGLDVVLDIVPNHMAASDENPFWRDESLRSQFFDLDEGGGHRRFFDIDDLAGVRVEDPEVFATTHAKVLELVGDGVVAGVRVDHIDGLADPAGYLQRLRDAGIRHVWVEKIVEPGEALPQWPIEGTTGYEFLVDADALFVDPEGREALDAAVGPCPTFADIAAEAKAQQVRSTFAPEVARLRRLADLPQLETGLAALPVYRTYLDPETRAVSPQDAAAIQRLPAEIADALRMSARAPAEFVVRFQQTTGAIMAKGVEDTAMYRHVRLLALNEVGGNPDRFGLAVDDFHAANVARCRDWPRMLLGATTHDTKRSADTRARIGALAGLGADWRRLVEEWRALFLEHRRHDAPDDDEQLFVLETLVGAWPIARERLDGYLVKALREAKRHTSWVDGDPEWERDVVEATARLTADPRFRDSFLPFLADVLDAADRSSLGQLVLRCTSPGVPDVYQGDELWNQMLVDPDNRRPVDWDVRRLLLGELRAGARPSRYSAKLFVTTTLLALRRRADGFAAAAYEPLAAPADVCAFARGPAVVVAVPVRPTAELLTPDELGVEGGRDAWTDLLAPLDDTYGRRRPAVFERAVPDASTRSGREGSPR